MTEEPFFLSFSDLKRLFLRHAASIKKIALLSAFVFFVVLLFQEPKYKATASFRQASGKNIPEQAFKSLLKNMLFQESEPNAMSAMQSRRLMRAVIQEMGLQATVSYPSLFSRSFGRAGRSIAAELRMPLPEKEAFRFRDLFYDREKAETYYLRLVTAETFELLNEKKETLALGKRGEKVHSDHLSFTLVHIPEGAGLNRPYKMTVKPWPKLAKRLLASLYIKLDRRDKNLLHLSFSHSDRHQAADFLNQLMASYQNYLKKENEEIAIEQLIYLQKREDELAKKFDCDLLDQVAYMKKNLGEGGFIGLRQEIEMLSVPEEEYTSRLFEMDLEEKRFNSRPLLRLAQAKQQSDEEQEVKKLRAAEELPISYSYEAKKEELQQGLLHLEKEERHHLLNGAQEGNPVAKLDLESSKKLYADYMQQLDSLEASIRQLRFFCDEMKRPGFELSSLTSVLSDPISQEMVRKASHYALELQDEGNRSLKDQERLSESLETQKRFILDHIGQTIELFEVRAHLLEEKIASLESTSLSLIRQERQLIQEKLHELKARMATLPDKWRLEHQLKFKTDLSMGIMEGMAQLVESKNINQNLYQVESRPLDFAIAPFKAEPQGLIAFPLLAAILGGAGLFGFQLFQGIRKGLPLSTELLHAHGQRVLNSFPSSWNGTLAQASRSDLELLRSLANFATQGKCIAVIETRECPIASPLAELLAMRDLKVLLLHCSFDGILDTAEAPGLWHLLQGEVANLPTHRVKGYDSVFSGVVSHHGAELLASRRWERLIAEIKPCYDLVLLVSRAHPTTAEAKALLPYSEAALLVVKDETLDELRPYIEWQRRGGALNFLMRS